VASGKAAAGAHLCLETAALLDASQKDCDCNMNDCVCCPTWALALHQCTEKFVMHLPPAVLLFRLALLDLLFDKTYKGATS